MRSNDFIFKPAWVLSLRLTTYILIAGIVVFWMKYPAYFNFPFFAYSLLTLSLPLIFVLRNKIPTRHLFRVVAFLQTLFEIIIEIGIIYTTGNIQSAFSGLFILTIISSALVNNLAGTLGVASLISFAYAFIIWFGLAIAGAPGSATRALETIFSTQDAAFYNIFLHILTFYLIAFISGYLVERLKHKDEQLASASQALRQAQLDTNDILQHLNSGLMTIDREGRVIFFNRAAEEILGYREVDISGFDYRIAFGNRMPQLVENLREVLDYRRHFPRNEIEIFGTDGNIVPLGISTSLLLDERNEIRGVIAIFQDLTETKILEEKMRAADRMAAVGELSAAIAHEIRNPLAAISGSVEVLKAELNLTGQNRRLLDLIVRESSRLNNILSDFLLYARSNRPVFEKVELCRLVSDVFEVVRHHPSFQDNINLRLSVQESYIYIFGDEDKIKQVLINLIVNACEAIGESGGEVVVRIGQVDNDSIRLDITDSGPGIDKEHLAKIFDPFFSTKKDGTGLGLAIVQRLTENLKIDLMVKTAVGVGTTFALFFNRMPSKMAEISTPSSDAIAAETNRSV
ncbi:PAS protein [Candidatus Zixiibacteriota bacterium]|nr:PAS protein [candidate division Zixibacteria bacterium]